MQLRTVFQGLIALHQEEFPYNLLPREISLPLKSGNIVTVTGVRRCGKSSLLKLAINSLIESGIRKEQILSIGFDDERFAMMSSEDFDDILHAYRDMYPMQPLKDVYMFFDEIQLIKGWELFIMRVYKNYCRNIFITGSTAEMLSSEMASALRGYPDEYHEYVLSFPEYLKFKGIKADKYTEDGRAIVKYAFQNYCVEGAYPKVVLTETKSEKTKLLQSYFNTMMFRDLIEHYHISTSSSVVRYFLKRVMENLSKPTSVNNIYNEIKSMGMKVSKESLYEWLDDACAIFLFHKVPRYTKSLVKESMSPAKYYVADVGLRNAVLNPLSQDAGKALENIVFQYLQRCLGECDKLFFYKGDVECDFVVQRSDMISELVQVCWDLNEDNFEREISGIVEASKVTGCKDCRIITFEKDDMITRENLQIRVESIFTALL